jgi:uncharacterized protein
MTGLKVSDSLTLPIDAVTQTLATIGRRGAGKTYLATMIAEQMLDIGAQTIILDPVGNWWGLRLKADGKSKGKEIFIIGGRRGDVPISIEAGARIARLLVEKPISAIIDISEFRTGERKRFAADFAEEFFHLKKRQTSPVHIFIEEAQLFAPQFPRPTRKDEKFSEAEMLGAFEQIIRLGRNYGIGATLITQRPQSVNKEVLNQTECLFVLQVNGRQERDALQRWVEEHSASDRALVGELPGLHQGEGFVWSPSWLRIFERMHFAKKTTFDSTATPKVGATQKARVLTKLDVAALKSDLEEVITRAQKDDPQALRKRIAELERELKKKPAPAKEPEIDRASLLKAYKAEILSLLHSQIRPQLIKALDLDSSLRDLDKLTKALKTVRVTLDDPKRWGIDLKYVGPPKPKAPPPVRPMVQARALRAEPAFAEMGQPSNDGLTGPEQRILDAIAWFEAIGVTDPEQPAVAFLAGYSFKSSSYTVPRSILARKQTVEYMANGRIQLTSKGRALAHDTDTPATNAGLHHMIYAKLPGPEGRLLRPLIEAYPDAMTNEDLAHDAGYSAASSSYSVPRSRLKSFGLIEYPASGQVRARDILFPIGG